MTNEEIENFLTEAGKKLQPEFALMCVNSILHNEDKLEKVAAMSYAHPLGFYRIPLVVLGEEYIRLHIWGELSANRKEAMHEHNFDFVSRLLIGGFTNHSYKAEKLDKAQEIIFAKIANEFSSPEARAELEELYEAEELTEEEFNKLKNNPKAYLQRYVYGMYGKPENRAHKPVEYAHSFMHNVVMTEYHMDKYKAGDVYFHGSDYVHKLELPNAEYTATLVWTKPADTRGGSLQRWCHNSSSEAKYARKKLVAEDLHRLLSTFIEKVSQAN